MGLDTKVRLPGPRLVFAAPGVFESGDLLLSKISAMLGEDALTGGTLGVAEEWFYVVNGDLYTLVREPELRNFEWRVQVRRVGV